MLSRTEALAHLRPASRLAGLDVGEGVAPPDHHAVVNGLTLSRQARAVVEFGASLGVSTLYLAAALRDSGGGSLITTELLASKAKVARKNLVDAGLDDLVELRVGDVLPPTGWPSPRARPCGR